MTQGANYTTRNTTQAVVFVTSPWNTNGTLTLPVPYDYDRYANMLDSLSPHDFVEDGDALPVAFRSVLVVSYVAIIALAVIGNAGVLLVVLANAKLRTVTNMFLVSLSASDLLIAGVNMPLQLRYYGQNEWVDGEVLCRIGTYIQGVVVVASIFTLTGIALDRYYAILHPLRVRHAHTVRRALMMIAIFWAAAFILVVPQLLLQRLEPKLLVEYDESVQPSLRIVQVCVEYFPSHGVNVAYTLFFYLVLYLLPVAIMIVTYGRIVHRLWTRRTIGETTACISANNRMSVARLGAPSTALTDALRRRLAEKKRIVRMLVVIVALFVVGWFPFFTIHVYQLFSDDVATTDAVDRNYFRALVAMLQLIGYANCCANPIVYCFLNDSFRQHLRRNLLNGLRIFCSHCCLARCRNWVAITSSSSIGRRRTDVSIYRRRGGEADGGLELATGHAKRPLTSGGVAMTSLVTTATINQRNRTAAEQVGGTDIEE